MQARISGTGISTLVIRPDQELVDDGLASGFEDVIVSANLGDNGRQPSRLMMSFVDVSV